MKRIITFLILIVILFPIKVYSSPAPSPIDLSVNPHTVLFDLSNVKPGDWVTRNLNVSNNGSQDFQYIISNKFLSGSNKFYRELKLTILDGKEIIFKGNLHEFSKMNARKLESNSSESINFHIEVPYELGNEFQGLTSEFEFNIYVEGTLGGVLPVDNRLPVTTTEIFNFILIGVALLTTGTVLFIFYKRKKKDVSRLKEKIIGP